MGKLEKILLFVMLFLVVCIGVVMALPDKQGNNGLQALTPVMDRTGRTIGRTFDRLSAQVARWSGSLLGETRRNVSPPAGGKNQGNPVDSAISPVQGYGEEQKNLFNKTIP